MMLVTSFGKAVSLPWLLLASPCPMSKADCMSQMCDASVMSSSLLPEDIPYFASTSTSKVKLQEALPTSVLSQVIKLQNNEC